MDKTDESHIVNLHEECKTEKTIYKRRSSLFYTRVTTCNQDNNETTNNIENELNKNKTKHDTHNEVFHLKEYTESLKQERKDWQQEYRNRKIQRKSLIKQKANLESQGQILDINVLTENEKVFLKERPNYRCICKNSQKMLNAALKISLLNQLIHKLDQRIMHIMEENLAKSTKHIIKMSEL